MVTPLLLGSSLGTAGTFYILGGVLLASLIFVLLTLPETKVMFSVPIIIAVFASSYDL